MTTFIYVLMACVFVSTFPQKAFAQNTPGDLEQAKNLFDFGDCEGAVVILKTIANAQNVDDEKTLVSANRMLGICLAQKGDEAGARAAFERLLFIDLDQVLDPFRTPPKVVTLFGKVKARIKADLDRIDQAKKPPEKKAPPAKSFLVERETRVVETPFSTVFVPFGAPQFQSDRPATGTALATLQGLSLLGYVVSMVTFVAIDASDGLDLRIGPAGGQTLVDVANAFNVAAWVSLVTGTLSYGYGMADAIYNFEPQTRGETEQSIRELRPKEFERLSKPLSE